jgi:transmembrane sensor
MERRDDGKRALISAEAAEWFVRLNDGDPNIEERQRFIAWLRESPLHIAEYLQIGRIHRRLKAAELQFDPAAVDGAPNVVELDTHDVGDYAEPAERPVRSHWKIAAAVAAFALAGILGTVVKYAWFDNIIVTQPSEWRHVKLADGSIVRVGPRTRMRVSFDDSRRAVELSRGEAVFQVVKDLKRPFLVNAGSTVVRAVGTEFGVTVLDDQVLVVVAEGVVSVRQNGRDTLKRPEREGADSQVGGVPSIEVSGGQQLRVAQVWPASVQKVDVRKALAWAEGKLIVENETVTEVVEQFNRRNRVQIVVDSRVADQPVGLAIYDVADPESFAEAVAVRSDIDLIKEPRDVLRLVPENWR